MKRSGELGIFLKIEPTGFLIFWMWGMMENGVKEEFLEFEPMQLDEQRCHSQKEEPPAGRGRARVCIRHPKSEKLITHPSADVKRTKKS